MTPHVYAPLVPTGCVARMRGSGARTPAPTCSGEPDVVRASQLQHAVKDVGSHIHLGGPTLLCVRAQPVSDHALEPADRSLGPNTFRVPGGLLPRPAALLSDELKMTVPLRGSCLGHLARHRGCARRHNDRRFGMALADAGVHALLVVRTIARH